MKKIGLALMEAVSFFWLLPAGKRYSGQQEIASNQNIPLKEDLLRDA